MSIGLDIGHFKSKIVNLSNIGENITATNVGSNNSFDRLDTFDPDSLTKAQWVASIQELLGQLDLPPKSQKDLTSGVNS